jgi:hypothetical protein
MPRLCLTALGLASDAMCLVEDDLPREAGHGNTPDRRRQADFGMLLIV